MQPTSAELRKTERARDWLRHGAIAAAIERGRSATPTVGHAVFGQSAGDALTHIHNAAPQTCKTVRSSEFAQTDT